MYIDFLASLGACWTWGVDSENRPQRGQYLPDLQAHSPAMGQEDGEKWTAAVDLQPTSPKSDRLLVVGRGHPLFNEQIMRGNPLAHLQKPLPSFSRRRAQLFGTAPTVFYRRVAWPSQRAPSKPCQSALHATTRQPATGRRLAGHIILETAVDRSQTSGKPHGY